MIVVLKRGAEQDKREQLINWLKNQGLGVHISEGEYQTVLGLIGDTARVDIDLIRELDIVDYVKRVQEPLRAPTASSIPTTRRAGRRRQVGGGNLCIMAGPCSVESEEQIVAVAKAVKASGANMLRGGAFKPRTSPYDFQGLKAEVGLRYLEIAKEETGLPIVTEMMDLSQLPLFKNVDVIQIGARNMQNFDLLKAVGRQEKPVMIKRGMSATYKELADERGVRHGRRQRERHSLRARRAHL